MEKLTVVLSILYLSINYVVAKPLATDDTKIKVTTPVTTESIAVKLESNGQQEKIIAIMRDRWRDNFIPQETVNKNLLHNYVISLNSSSNRLWEQMNKEYKIQQLWSDTLLDNNSNTGQLKLGVTLYTVYQRLFTLAKAWNTPGVDLYHNSVLLEQLTEILNKLNTQYYNSTTAELGNWWHWELGISRTVNNMLVVLYDQLPTSLIERYNQATRHFVRDPRYLAEGSGSPYSTTKNVFTSTGGNRIDSAQVVFVRGLLENNPIEISAAVNAIPVVLDTVDSGDGFYADGSFIQHKDIPYTGTYGQVLLNGLGMIKNNVSGTPWDFSTQENQRIYQVIWQTFLPWLYQGNMSDAVNGRSISRKTGQDQQVGASVINAIALFVDGAPEKEKSLLESALKAQLTPLTIKYYQSHLPENLSAWQMINGIQRDSKVQPLPVTVGGKLFPDMDRLIYSGNGYQIVVAMHSKRVGSYECINGENLRGQRTADGMTYLYLPDDDQYRDYWPLVDSQYLPGTTSAGKQGWCDEQYRIDRLGRANITWAGGVTLEQWASASMQLKVPASSLKAKKSWFMAPNLMVMLGSDISSSEPAVTTIANRKLSDMAQVKMNNVELQVGEHKKVSGAITLNDHGRKIIWQPLAQQNAVVSIKNRTGDWHDIGTSSGKLSANFLTIMQPNDKSSGNNYSWLVYPNQSKIITPVPKVLANSSDVQAIELADKTVYVNFWRSAKMGNLQALTPLALIIHPTMNSLIISVSSPKRDQRVSFRLPGKISIKQDDGQRVTVQDGIISVDVSHLRGSSYIFQLIMDK